MKHLVAHMIEAFATGTPVVASNVGAMKEIVSSGQNGLHFQAGSAADLASKVNRLAANDNMRTGMGQRARQTYEARFTAERNYEMLINIYDLAKSRQK